MRAHSTEVTQIGQSIRTLCMKVGQSESYKGKLSIKSCEKSLSARGGGGRLLLVDATQRSRIMIAF